MVDWCKIVGISQSNFCDRYYRLGWSIEKTLETPIEPVSSLITFNNITMNQKEWEIKLGFPKGTIHSRIRCGWSIEKILITPHKKRGGIR